MEPDEVNVEDKVTKFVRALHNNGVDVTGFMSTVATVYSHALIANVSGVQQPKDRLLFARQAVEDYFECLMGDAENLDDATYEED